MASTGRPVDSKTLAIEGLPATRAQAKRLGVNRYFTGRACVNGHVCPYWVSSGCILCSYHNMDCFRRRKREYNRDYMRRERLRDPQRVNSRELANKRKRLGLVPTRPQPSLCECCGKPPGKKGIALDHDHKTGKFRGWLCAKCNLGIGALGDSMEAVLAAIAYLERAAREGSGHSILREHAA